MKDQEIVFVAIGVAVVMGVLVLRIVGRRSAAMREILRTVAASAGWSEISDLRLRAGVKGTWRSFAVSIAYMARQKSVPQRLVVNVGAVTDTRLSIKRRFSGFLSNRPLAWFGPPLVEPHAPAAGDFWVRANEPNLAERLFAEAPVADAIANAMTGRFDEIKVNARGLRILRALDETAVRQKYGMPTFTMRFEPARFEPLAREAWIAAEAVAQRLAMI